MTGAERPLVIVTRKLPEVVETRLRELFDARLNLDDTPLSREQLVEAVQKAGVSAEAVARQLGRAVQRSIHDAHGEDCTDAAEGDAMPTI